VKIKLSFVLAVLAVISLFGRLQAQAQTDDPSIKATTVFGKVSEINAAAGQITIKTAAGSVVVAKVNEKTTYQRMPPGETDRSKGVPTSLTEITVGDGVIARGFIAADKKSVPAQQIIVVSQSDIAKKQEQERMEWRRRGVSGIVASLNPAAKEVTISSRSLMGATQAIIIPISDRTRVRRYSQDSIKYADSKPSKFEEVKVGDQLRAKGDKSPDGTRVTAEEVVFGSFKIVGGTVAAIDPAANTITVNDLKTKQPMTIVLKPDSVVRRFQMMMGGMGPGGAPGGGAPAAGGGERPQGQGATPGAAQGPGAGGPQGPRPGGGMNMADLIERLPTISISEIKVGEMIVISTLTATEQNRFTAISMVTGVEPLLQMLAARQAAGGQARPQNVDLNSNFGGMFGGVGVP